MKDDMDGVAEALLSVAKALMADDDSEAKKGNLVFFIPYAEGKTYKDSRRNAEKSGSELHKFVDYHAGDFDPVYYMGTMGSGNEVALPVEFEKKSDAQQVIKAVKADPKAKKLGISVKWDND